MKRARFMFFFYFHKSVLTVGIDNGYRSLPECFKLQQNVKMLGSYFQMNWSRLLLVYY